MAGIVHELQKECLDVAAPVASILRKAKVIAAKLELGGLEDWIGSELGGYKCSAKDLPQHRKGRGKPQFLNPHHGWCPIHTPDNDFGEIVSTVFLFQSVSEMEHLVGGAKSESLHMSYDPVIAEVIQKQLPMRMDIGLKFSTALPISALEFVRNKTLDWTLELEAQGIFGDGFSFGEVQKSEARIVTNNIYGGNVGVLGSVSGDANNSRFVSINQTVSPERIQDFVKEVKKAVPGLPLEVQETVARVAQDIEIEAVNPNPSREKISEHLVTLRSVLEGSVGSLVAEGILGGIGGLLG